MSALNHLPEFEDRLNRSESEVNFPNEVEVPDEDVPILRCHDIVYLGEFGLRVMSDRSEVAFRTAANFSFPPAPQRPSESERLAREVNPFPAPLSEEPYGTRERESSILNV